jgi:hypothetical protein
VLGVALFGSLAGQGASFMAGTHASLLVSAGLLVAAGAVIWRGAPTPGSILQNKLDEVKAIDQKLSD